MENEYINGKIYRIDIGEDFYIGSTKHTLTERNRCHIKAMDNGTPMMIYGKMRELGLDFTMVDLIIVKDFPCNTSQELRQEEGRLQVEMKSTLNERVAGRTQAQYYLDNQEECKRKNKQYYDEHREEQIEKKRIRREENKEELNEKSKQYYLEHQEERKEKNRQYHHDHKEERNQKSRNYREQHRDELNEKLRQKSTCQYCQKELNKNHMKRHHQICPDRPSPSS